MSATVRQMTRDELDIAIGWAEAEGWGPGRGDADAFWAADPEGFWALDLNDEMAACISAVHHAGGVVFMGFYIVRPEHRATGLGKRLWDEVWAKLDGLVLAGDAVPQQVANYEKDGFVVAHRNSRWTGHLATNRAHSSSGDDAGGAANAASNSPAPTQSLEGTSLLRAGEVEFEALVEYDGRHCFGERPAFLSKWLESPERSALVAVDATGRITGFGVIRPASGADRIGPLFADHTHIARALLLALTKGRETPVAIDVPAPNTEAVAMVKGLGLTPAFETSRIYRGEDPSLPLGRIFGITSLELG